MARSNQVLWLRVQIDPAVQRAFMEDLLEIHERFGMPEDVQPHKRAAYEAEIERAKSVFSACFACEIIG